MRDYPAQYRERGGDGERERGIEGDIKMGEMVRERECLHIGDSLRHDVIM